jgi:hypothetical protein
MKTDPKEKRAETRNELTLHTLDDLAKALGKPDPEVVEELFEGVTTAVLLAFGRRADSAVLYTGVPAFVGSVQSIWAGLKPVKRAEVIGYAEEFLPVLVYDAVALRALHGRFSLQGPRVAVEVSRRKEAARGAFANGRGLRDQGARLLRRVTRGHGEDASGLETSIGTAGDAASLAAGLTFVADEVKRQITSGSPARKRLMARVRLNAAYEQRLRDAAEAVVTTHNSATAAAQEGVSQEELDEADGRVMHVVDWVYRAFKEANELDDAIRVPELGTLAPYFTTKRAAPKSDEEGGEKPVNGGVTKPV